MPAPEHHRPIVFAGPSLSWATPGLLERIELRPPARRGSLDALRGGAPGTAILIDGLFGSVMSVTPTECRELIEDGWTLVGASSMGALRAAELYSVGMIGIGYVYSLLRLGVIVNDAELAVAYHDRNFKELTIALVHLRYVLSHAPVLSDLSPEVAKQVFAAARACHWIDRSAPELRHRLDLAGIDGAIADLIFGSLGDDRLHPKQIDARLAIETVLDGTRQMEDP